MDVRRISAHHPDAIRLVDAMFAGVRALYGQRPDQGPSATPEEMSPPGGAYVAIYDGDAIVAGGGLKRLDATTAEIKRMYVVPERRGEGLSRMLLTAIEDAARDLGYDRVRLDTGARQDAALRLYPSAGYLEIDDYNGNVYASYWGEKRL